MRSRLALLILDLNGFKIINDTMGHQAGDQVLREVSSHLRKSVRASDTLARLGGDEFIIVATDLGVGPVSWTTSWSCPQRHGEADSGRGAVDDRVGEPGHGGVSG